MTATISLYALAAFLGVAPAVLRVTFARAGVRLASNDRASEGDLARVFGPAAARDFLDRVAAARPRR